MIKNLAKSKPRIHTTLINLNQQKENYWHFWPTWTPSTSDLSKHEIINKYLGILIAWNQFVSERFIKDARLLVRKFPQHAEIDCLNVIHTQKYYCGWKQSMMASNHWSLLQPQLLRRSQSELQGIKALHDLGVDDESAIGLVPRHLQRVHARCVRDVSDHDLGRAAVTFGTYLHVLRKGYSALSRSPKRKWHRRP